MPDGQHDHEADLATTAAGYIDTLGSAPLTGAAYPRSASPALAVPYGWKPRTGAVGLFLSDKNRCGIPFWDKFELAFARQAERTPKVLRYAVRPTSMLGMLPFVYVPCFELSTSFGEMVVEISDRGQPSCDEEIVRVTAIRKLLDASEIMFTQFSTDEVSRRKLFGRSRPLRPGTNDYWSRSERADVASFWKAYETSLEKP